MKLLSFFIIQLLITLDHAAELNVFERNANDGDEDTKKQPNLVIVMSDQQSIRTLGCYRNILGKDQSFLWGEGNKVDTPNIDRLANEGALFANWHVTTPICTPSRASFMSGLYPKATGAWANDEGLYSNITTFAHIFKEEGYRTGYFGKWHLDGTAKPGFNISQDYGWGNTQYRFNRGHWKWMKKKKGVVKVFNFSSKDKFVGKWEKNYITDFLFDRGIKFMTKHSSRAFVTMISIPDPHAPNQVRAPYDTMFNNLTFDVPPTLIAAYERNPSRPSFMDTNFNHSHASTKIEAIRNDPIRQHHLRQYFGMIACLDDNVGKLLSFLESSHLSENTIVIFTADHGDALLEHGKENKGTPYKASVSSPFVIRYPPKIKPGKIIQSAYSSIDFFPTIMSLMDIHPKNHKQNDTLSSLPGLDASEELLSNETVTVRNNTRYITDGRRSTYAAAVTSRFKLVLNRWTPWLFDLERDPDELINYAGDLDYQDIFIELRDGLKDAVFQHNFTMLDRFKVFMLDFPQCIDSIDRLLDQPNLTCRDLSVDLNLSASHCVKASIRTQCPFTCRKCCEDSEGHMVMKTRNILSCLDMKKNTTIYSCDTYPISRFCQQTCGLCPTVAPTIFPVTDQNGVPSSNPSAIHTHLPSKYLPSNFPTSSPSPANRHPTVLPTTVLPSQYPTNIPPTTSPIAVCKENDISNSNTSSNSICKKTWLQSLKKRRKKCNRESFVFKCPLLCRCVHDEQIP